jgi:hypothetical protein
MTNDMKRALDSIAYDPSPEFIAQLADRLAAEMTSEALPQSSEAETIALLPNTQSLPSHRYRGRATQTRSAWQTVLIGIAAAAVIVTAVAIVRPFRRENPPGIHTGPTTDPARTLTTATATTSTTTNSSSASSTVPLPAPSTVSSIPSSPPSSAAVPPTSLVVADAWERLPDAPLPGNSSPLVVAMGDEILVAGGLGPLRSEGAAFDGQSWRRIPDSPMPVVGDASAVWTGSNVLVVGTDGTVATFTPGEDRWSVIGTAPTPRRTGASVVWTGIELLIVGGAEPNVTALGGFNVVDSAIGFTPSTKQWRTIPQPPTPDALTGPSLWTGTEWIRTVGGSEGKFEGFGVMAAFNPTTNRWRTLPDFPADPLTPTTLLMESSTVVRYTSIGRWKLVDDRWTLDAAIPVSDHTGVGLAWLLDGRAVFTDGTEHQTFQYRRDSGGWAYVNLGMLQFGINTVVQTKSGQLTAVSGNRVIRLRPIVDPTVGVPFCTAAQLQVPTDIGTSGFIPLVNATANACAVDGQRPKDVAFHTASGWVDRAPPSIVRSEGNFGGFVPAGGATRVTIVRDMNAGTGRPCLDDRPTLTEPIDAVRFTFGWGGEPITVKMTLLSECPDLAAIMAEPKQ